MNTAMQRAGRRWEPGCLGSACCTRFGAANQVVFGRGEGGQLQRFCHRTEVPRPALRGEGEVKNPARRSPGGRRKETTIHQKPLPSFEFLVLSLGSYFDQQELWSEIIHCWLTAGWREAERWNESESFVIVTIFPLEFSLFDLSDLYSVLDKESVDSKVLA